MIKKFFIIINLLLAGVFIWKLIALYTEIEYNGIKVLAVTETAPIDIKRPVLRLSPEYRNIFGLTPPKTVKKSPVHQTDKGALTELPSGDEVIRVTGIFISENARYAVISIFNKEKRTYKIKRKKVGLGDKIKDFSVVSILPGSVCLADSASHKIDLRIFKPF
ncbi:MAG: hypothetical protein GWP10_16390 [Nitrospiraceae bacterium]|nr:hypothetical protein [Nitrospiraceae bacterium]